MRTALLIAGGILAVVVVAGLVRSRKVSSTGTSAPIGPPVQTTTSTTPGRAVIAPDPGGRLPGNMVRTAGGTILGLKEGILAPQVSLPGTLGGWS